MRNLLVTCGITVALLLTGSVYAAEEITWEQGKEINLGEKALDVALTDDGKLAYILTKKNISVHNLQDGRIIGTIPLDEKFAGISIAPRAKLLLLKSTDGKKYQL